MPFENSLGVSDLGNLVAAADLSGSQFCLVSVDANGLVALPSGQGVRTIGVLQNAPTAGQEAQVRVFGVSRVKANGVITHVAVGANITPAGTTGKAETASSGDFVAGYTLGETSAAGDLITCFINPTLVPLA